MQTALQNPLSYSSYYDHYMPIFFFISLVIVTLWLLKKVRSKCCTRSLSNSSNFLNTENSFSCPFPTFSVMLQISETSSRSNL